MSEPLVITFDDRSYKINREIGKGSFAVVHLATGIHDKMEYAVKIINTNKLKGRLLDNLSTEISLLKKLKHKNVVNLVDIVKSDVNIYLVMEYCSLGDLYHFIKKRGWIFNESYPAPKTANQQLQQQFLAGYYGGIHEHVAIFFLKQLASSMEFLRAHSLIHRDIKPQNLLLSPPTADSPVMTIADTKIRIQLPILKIADFGFARLLPSQSLASTLCGSPLYMAPEILRGDNYDAKADLWSIGAVAYEMLFGRPPYRAQNHVDLLRKIEKSSGVKFPAETAEQVPSHMLISADIRDFITRLLKKNPVERIGFEEFFLHPAIFGFNDAPASEIIKESPVLQFNPDTSPTAMNSSQQQKLPPASSSQKNSNPSIPSCSSSFNNSSSIKTSYNNQTKSSAKKTPSFIPQEKVPVPSHDGTALLIDPPFPGYQVDPSVFVQLFGDVEPPKFTKKAEPTLITKTSSANTELVGNNNNPSTGTPIDEYVVVEKNSVQVNWFADKIQPTSTIQPVYNPKPSDKSLALIKSHHQLSNIPERKHEIICPNFIKVTQIDSNADKKILLVEDVGIPILVAVSDDNGNEIEGSLDALNSCASQGYAIQLLGDEQTGAQSANLYIAALAIYQVGMDMAKNMWEHNTRIMKEKSGKDFYGSQLNLMVQWIRSNFNHCLDRAAVDHPVIDGKVEHVKSAETIIYERALELSEVAGKNEQMLLDLQGSEVAYEQSILLLEALLALPNQENQGISDDDRAIIEQLVASLYIRVQQTKRKIEEK